MYLPSKRAKFAIPSLKNRYTPIGSWVRNLGGINQNSITNMGGEEMEGFLGNTQKSGDMSYGDSGNYIWYQPM
ncbi:PIR Superfamily Protein [Plasmodium ovale wallikeri]|uniref:PIR Superfamily Protein n=1 Tax=Plasmodium ovale wallikeri TaxID=864142 RepID=A0A1A9A996_PLAOA|nr:PIR Superfamily Protein [Plasmodium ovale wallikeri]